MFYENSPELRKQGGWIEVISGSMFSGKTEELIRRLRRARIAQQKVVIFKPVNEDRYSKHNVVSHDESSIDSVPVSQSEEILAKAQGADVVGVDEAQFFDNKLPGVCNKLANKGLRVIVAGLDMDYRGEPFGPVPALLALADDVIKLHAICIQCGNLAQFSHRKSETKDLFLLGEKDIYEPLCRECYYKAVSH
jgi:thymidine kinase